MDNVVLLPKCHARMRRQLWLPPVATFCRTFVISNMLSRVAIRAFHKSLRFLSWAVIVSSAMNSFSLRSNQFPLWAIACQDNGRWLALAFLGWRSHFSFAARAFSLSLAGDPRLAWSGLDVPCHVQMLLKPDCQIMSDRILGLASDRERFRCLSMPLPIMQEQTSPPFAPRWPSQLSLLSHAPMPPHVPSAGAVFRPLQFPW